MSTPLKALIQERLRAKIVRQGDEEVASTSSFYEDEGSGTTDSYHSYPTTLASTMPLIDLSEYVVPSAYPLSDARGSKTSRTSRGSEPQDRTTTTRYTKEYVYPQSEDHLKPWQAILSRYHDSEVYADEPQHSWRSESPSLPLRRSTDQHRRQTSVQGARSSTPHTYQDTNNQEEELGSYYGRHDVDKLAPSDDITAYRSRVAEHQPKRARSSRYQPYRSTSKHELVPHRTHDRRHGEYTLSRSSTSRTDYSVLSDQPERPSVWHHQAEEFTYYEPEVDSHTLGLKAENREYIPAYVATSPRRFEDTYTYDQLPPSRLVMPPSTLDHIPDRWSQRTDAVIRSTSDRFEHIHVHDDVLSPGSQQSAEAFVEKRQKRTSQGTPRTMATQRWLQSIADARQALANDDARYRDNQEDRGYQFYTEPDDRHQPRSHALSKDSTNIAVPHAASMYSTVV